MPCPKFRGDVPDASPSPPKPRSTKIHRDFSDLHLRVLQVKVSLRKAVKAVTSWENMMWCSWYQSANSKFPRKFDNSCTSAVYGCDYCGSSHPIKPYSLPNKTMNQQAEATAKWTSVSQGTNPNVPTWGQLPQATDPDVTATATGWTSAS